MPISIGSNIQALRVQRRLGENTAALSSVFERLSSGQRINTASDDAAGLAISMSLDTDSRVFTQAIRNVNDGISALAVAEGGIKELSNLTIRLKELAEQSANGVYSDAQRQALDSEANALRNEYNRIVESTSFNGLRLLDRSVSNLSLQEGYGVDGAVSISIGDQLSRAQGNGSLAAAVTYYGDSLQVNGDVDTADFNGDGNQDLVISAQNRFDIVLGNGDGTFKAPTNISTAGAGTGHDVTAADFNNDGFEDVVYSASAGVFGVALGNGNGTFKAPVSQVSYGSVSAGGHAVADFNADGKLDVAMRLLSAASTQTLAIAFGNGNGTFSASAVYDTVTNDNSASNATLQVGDVNNDNVIDIVTSSLASTVFSVFLGNSNGSFKSSISISAVVAASGLDFGMGDYNSDGKLDIAYSGQGAIAYLYLGNGDGRFKAGTSVAGPSSRMGQVLSSVDINEDGFLDIVGDYQSVLIRLGNGNGTFKAWTSATGGAGATGTNFKGFAFADFNGDEVLDVVNSSYPNAQGVHVLLQNTELTNSMRLIDLSTQADALTTLDRLDTVLNRINSELGVIGSHQSRAQSALNTLASARENFQAANSRIIDADIAAESAQAVRLTILQQSASAILGNANQLPTLALTLLRG